MAKTNKEDINDIRSLIEDVDAAQNKVIQQQATLEQQLNKVTALLEAIKNNGIAQAPNSVNIDKEIIADAVRSALGNTSQENNKQGALTLSAENQKMIVETAITGLSNYLKEGEKVGEQKHKQEVEEYEAARSKQGLSTVAEVNEWAPEYSFSVQRWLRWIGRQIISKDEEATITHKALKTIGNALQLLEGHEPTLKVYLHPKWRRWKRHIKSFRFWYMFSCFYLMLGAIVCLALYQSRVMDIERKNTIIRYHFRNDKTYQREYQHIDSLLHHYDVFDAYKLMNGKE